MNIKDKKIGEFVKKVYYDIGYCNIGFIITEPVLLVEISNRYYN